MSPAEPVAEGAITELSLTDQRLAEDAVQLTRELIRHRTVNPPGNEREAQEMLASKLSNAGFECRLLGRTDARPNLVARLRGAAPGPRLCLLSHVDTVLAHAADWDHDPWSGDLADGFVWGRGALDMKSQTAAEVAAACSLAQAGWRPARGELLVVVLVDEETGGGEGAMWLTETHPELVRCAMLINEGGGWRIEVPLPQKADGETQVIYGLGCAEKGVFRFTITTDGVAGHASMPRAGRNALLDLAPLISRLARQPGFDLTPEPTALLEAIGETTDDPQAALERVRARQPELAVWLEPMLGVSLAPTRVWASEKINVIPDRATVLVDCRVPPGLGEAHARRRIEEVLGTSGYRLEFTETVMGNRSPLESELADAIRAWVAENDPGALCVPSVLPGFTDSRTFREAFPECCAYGFFPHRYMGLTATSSLVHAANERIDVRDVGFAARFFRDVAQRVLA